MKIKEGMILIPNMNNMDNTKLRVLQVGMGRVFCETLDGRYVGDINDSNNCDDVLYYYDISQPKERNKIALVKFEVSETSFTLEVDEEDLTEERLNEIGCEYVANNIYGIAISINGRKKED